MQAGVPIEGGYVDYDVPEKDCLILLTRYLVGAISARRAYGSNDMTRRRAPWVRSIVLEHIDKWSTPAGRDEIRQRDLGKMRRWETAGSMEGPALDAICRRLLGLDSPLGDASAAAETVDARVGRTMRVLVAFHPVLRGHDGAEACEVCRFASKGEWPRALHLLGTSERAVRDLWALGVDAGLVAPIG